MADGRHADRAGDGVLSRRHEIGPDVTIEPNVVFGPGVRRRAAASTIQAFCHLEGATIGDGRRSSAPSRGCGPARRSATDVHIGNFVEVKKAVHRKGAKANHLTYLGDAQVGAGANIGAGTITCNYDGFVKYRTEIGAGAFIGSNTALVAPVTIGDGAYVGAGSVITQDVAGDALAVERGDADRQAPAGRAKFRAKRAEKRQEEGRLRPNVRHRRHRRQARRRRRSSSRR